LRRASRAAAAAAAAAVAALPRRIDSQPLCVHYVCDKINRGRNYTGGRGDADKITRARARIR